MFEMTSDYPNTQITGVDISPVQPTEIKLQNVNFVKANLLNGLPFENDTFDYIFQRFLFSAIPKDSWPDVMNELTRVLKPGGYLESLSMGSLISKNDSKDLPTSDDHFTNFQYLGGRRYHNESNSSYFLPNDDKECDRLHLQHFLIKSVRQGNFSAPVEDILNKEGSKVLDVGCGAGSWTFDMATNYPKSQIVGIDISPIPSSSEIKPKNITFIQTNVLNGLPFEDNSFDFIFQRFLILGIPADKWNFLINELIRVLKPGGFLELIETSPKFSPMGPYTSELMKSGREMLIKKNLNPNVAYELESLIANQEELENNKCVKYQIFYGNKADKLGQTAILNQKNIFSTTKIHMMNALQVGSEEYDVFTKNVLEELREYESTQDFNCVYASKIF
ncbi:10265_t:CDS:2 [Diversispora eburnea]|uniref:10265_t:CDS:1 n=1 Tax=Diversispora eburnea TaxID=1213867 RepID=A0A9N8YYY0_9GLOM|nr:10265_t:CDS:2 [Diversispora eburnea]